ncbi:MAG: hypothetical protein E5X15_22045, partial [Mesorhizobium sp.]
VDAPTFAPPTPSALAPTPADTPCEPAPNPAPTPMPPTLPPTPTSSAEAYPIGMAIASAAARYFFMARPLFQGQPCVAPHRASARQRSAKPSSRERVPSDGDFSPCQASASAVTGAAGGRSKDE